MVVLLLVVFGRGFCLSKSLIDEKVIVIVVTYFEDIEATNSDCLFSFFSDHKVSIGVTTGNVFCGTIGATERKDYAGEWVFFFS